MKHTTFTLTWAVVGVGMALALNEPCRGEENPSASDTGAATKAVQQKSKAAKKTDKIDPLHEPYDKLLRAHVKNGWVNYKAFKQQEARLDAYLKTLAQTDPAKLTKSERLAYWINAYNAFTIKLILRRYPKIKSIKDIPGRWDRREWTAGGKTYSLGEIEHQILRKRFNEPRIHFAIVCASKSCPDLPSEAYTAKRLDRQLTAAAKRFLADTKKGLQTRREKGFLWGHNNYVYLSSIFNWFAEDFEKHGGSVIAFIKPYVSKKQRAFLEKHKDDFSIRYLDYDWSLNGK